MGVWGCGGVGASGRVRRGGRVKRAGAYIQVGTCKTCIHHRTNERLNKSRGSFLRMSPIVSISMCPDAIGKKITRATRLSYSNEHQIQIDWKYFGDKISVSISTARTTTPVSYSRLETTPSSKAEAPFRLKHAPQFPSVKFQLERK